jgi:hypothetical protein
MHDRGLKGCSLIWLAEPERVDEVSILIVVLGIMKIWRIAKPTAS